MSVKTGSWQPAAYGVMWLVVYWLGKLWEKSQFTETIYLQFIKLFVWRDSPIFSTHSSKHHQHVLQLISHLPNASRSPTVNGISTQKSWGHGLWKPEKTRKPTERAEISEKSKKNNYFPLVLMSSKAPDGSYRYAENRTSSCIHLCDHSWPHQYWVNIHNIPYAETLR